MNYLFFYLTIWAIFVFASLARSQTLDSDETNNEKVNPEVEKPRNNVTIPSNWRSRCLEDRPWCDALIDSLLAAKEINRLFEGEAPRTKPTEVQLQKLMKECKVEWKDESSEKREKAYDCYMRRAIFISLFGSETQTVSTPAPFPYPADWKTRCSKDHQWCEKFLDWMISKRAEYRLFNGKKPPLVPLEIVDDIATKCKVGEGDFEPEKAKKEEACLRRRTLYWQLFEGIPTELDFTIDPNICVPPGEAPTIFIWWKRWCLEDLQWCESFLTGILPFEKAFEDLFGNADPRKLQTPTREQWKRIAGECSGTFDVPVCIKRRIFYDQLFSSEVNPTTETPQEMFVIPQDWKKRCEEDRAWCDAFLDKVIASGPVGKLYEGKMPHRLSKWVMKKIEALCDKNWPSDRWSEENLKCLQRGYLYEQLFGKEENAQAQVAQEKDSTIN